ncbi:MAG: hypothetical protein SGILL_001011, partial [Bacillariaceae sp.]
MTVSSLWKALDRAGSGQCVGAKELQNHHQFQKNKKNETITPWNVRQLERQQASLRTESIKHRPVLAVDLSIWICEALTSSSMQQNHVADPPLQLVYSRALKLLNLGIKLVVVVEGKRRIRRNILDNENIDANAQQQPQQQDKFRKRRSGAPFWSACQRCETMLQALGIPVVRAKAEGEALCALLNQKGIVDGIISNDGDCFLFGAKVLYTKFSIENLEQSRVMRYDAGDIRACLDDDDADKFDETGQKSEEGDAIVRMTRNDLIAFAILTGSDLAGDGLDKVGCRKAIRFIRKCRIDNPLKLEESPAIKELISWGKAASRFRKTPCTSNDHDDKEIGTKRTCGCCGHPGSKRSHMKLGCNICGTGPGEACFPLSPGGKFRKMLRSKALDMGPKFDPSSTIELYNRPNENQLPLLLVGKTARNLEMQPPKLQSLVRSKFVIRGANVRESRQYIQKSLAAYMARTQLFLIASGPPLSKLPKNPNRPTPVRVTKFVTRSGVASCEVQWVIKATITDEEGNSLDQYDFSTIEEEKLIQDSYPDLLLNFKERKEQLEAQGDAEQEKRKAFIANMFVNTEIDLKKKASEAKKLSKPRKSFFEGPPVAESTAVKVKGRSDDLHALLLDIKKASRKRSGSRMRRRTSDERKKEQVSDSGGREIRSVREMREGPTSGCEKRKATDAQKDRLSCSNGKAGRPQGCNKKESSSHEENQGSIKKEGLSAFCGDDVAKIVQYLTPRDDKGSEDSTIDTASILACSPNVRDRRMRDTYSYCDASLTPGHIHFLNGSKGSRRAVAVDKSRLSGNDREEPGRGMKLPKNVWTVAGEPFHRSVFTSEAINIGYNFESSRDHRNDHSAKKVPEKSRRDTYQDESSTWPRREDPAAACPLPFDSVRENGKNVFRGNDHHPPLQGRATPKHQRQFNLLGVLRKCTSPSMPCDYAVPRTASLSNWQEQKVEKRSFSRSPHLKRRKTKYRNHATDPLEGESPQCDDNVLDDINENTESPAFLDAADLHQNGFDDTYSDFGAGFKDSILDDYNMEDNRSLLSLKMSPFDMESRTRRRRSSRLEEVRKHRIQSNTSNDMHHNHSHYHDDSLMNSDFLEEDFSEDPFITSMLEGEYFDHRDDFPNMSSGFSGYNARGEDRESECRRRVEEQKAFVREQAEINKFHAETLGYQDGN